MRTPDLPSLFPTTPKFIPNNRRKIEPALCILQRVLQVQVLARRNSRVLNFAILWMSTIEPAEAVAHIVYVVFDAIVVVLDGLFVMSDVLFEFCQVVAGDSLRNRDTIADTVEYESQTHTALSGRRR